MRKALIDVVAKAIGPNTAITFVTVFGSQSTVMVINARTRRLIGTVTRDYSDAHQAMIYTLYGEGRAIIARHMGLEVVLDALKKQRGYAVGRNQNYSKAVYKVESFA